MNRKKILFFIITIVLTLFIGTEILLRIKYNEQLKIRHFPLIYQSDSLFGYTYTPNAKGYISMPSIEKHFKLNKWGLYGKNFSMAKEDTNTNRIIVIGDSNESGVFMSTDSNYVFCLDKLFKANGYNVEVLNFAKDGTWKVLYNIEYLKRFAINFDPDYIIFNNPIPFTQRDLVRQCYRDYVFSSNPNNSKSKQYCKDLIDKIEKKYLFKTLYKLSFVYRAYCKKYIDHPENKQTEKYKYLNTFITRRYIAKDCTWYRYSNKKSAEIIKELDVYLKTYNCKLILLNYYSDASYRALLDYYNIKFIDLELNKRKFDKPLSHEHDGHFNTYGHKVTANILYKALVSNGFVTK